MWALLTTEHPPWRRASCGRRGAPAPGTPRSPAWPCSPGGAPCPGGWGPSGGPGWAAGGTPTRAHAAGSAAHRCRQQMRCCGTYTATEQAEDAAALDMATAMACYSDGCSQLKSQPWSSPPGVAHKGNGCAVTLGSHLCLRFDSSSTYCGQKNNIESGCCKARERAAQPILQTRATPSRLLHPGRAWLPQLLCTGCVPLCMQCERSRCMICSAATHLLQASARQGLADAQQHEHGGSGLQTRAL
jgi:hypothetical protein